MSEAYRRAVATLADARRRARDPADRMRQDDSGEGPDPRVGDRSTTRRRTDGSGRSTSRSSSPRGTASSAAAARACSRHRRPSWCRAAARTARTSPTARTGEPHRASWPSSSPTSSGSSRRSARRRASPSSVGKDERRTDWRTRLVDDACIFLNRPGCPSRPGLRAAPVRHADRQHHSDAQARGVLAAAAAPPRRGAGRRDA